MAAEVQEVVKGGESWLQISEDRRSKGVEIWVKVDPRVEEFMAALGEGKSDPLEMYGKNWFSPDPEKPIHVYKYGKDIDTESYTLNVACGNVWGREQVNMTFLRFVGIGGDGVRFVVAGPCNLDAIRAYNIGVLRASRKLFYDYMVPVHVNLRISSQELLGV